MNKLDHKIIAIANSNQPLSGRELKGVIDILESNNFIKILWIIAYYTRPYLSFIINKQV